MTVANETMDDLEAGRVLTLRDFDYPFPEGLVAQTPRAERDRARLLVRGTEGQLKHTHVSDLTTELATGTLLILNDTRVFPSRLLGRLPTGGQVELFLLEPVPAGEAGKSAWRALGRPLKKLKLQTQILLPGGVSATVLAKYEDGAGNAFVDLEFGLAAGPLSVWLDTHGYVPLPPYIKRPLPEPASRSSERDRYQTVYAREPGSVAAPTAGLHFTEALLTALRHGGIEIRSVSLHVGAGTFLPVKSETVASHRMHAERYRVGRQTAQALLDARSQGRPVVAVGTTTLRSLEDLYRHEGRDGFAEGAEGWRTTELFLHPRTARDRYRPWVIDGLITNFHQPCSTLFMLVSMLLGLPEAKALYRAAIADEYQLYSYGDASLLWL